VKPVGQQLSFEDIALRAIATDLPKIETLTFRWRKLVRRLDPLGKDVSRATFQLVAGALADYADRNGESCYPTVAQLAADTGRSERAVQYALRELIRWRVVEADRSGGRGRASQYRLVGARANDRSVPVDKPVENERVPDLKGARADTKRVQPLAPQVRHEDRQFREPDLTAVQNAVELPLEATT
jgi:hypothetical protein